MWAPYIPDVFLESVGPPVGAFDADFVKWLANDAAELHLADVGEQAGIANDLGGFGFGRHIDKHVHLEEPGNGFHGWHKRASPLADLLHLTGAPWSTVKRRRVYQPNRRF